VADVHVQPKEKFALAIASTLNKDGSTDPSNNYDAVSSSGNNCQCYCAGPAVFALCEAHPAPI
jgi:hypothetical protein